MMATNTKPQPEQPAPAHAPLDEILRKMAWLYEVCRSDDGLVNCTQLAEEAAEALEDIADNGTIPEIYYEMASNYASL